MTSFFSSSHTSSKDELLSNFQFMDIPFLYIGKYGKISVMIQKKMEFDRSFGLSVHSPVEEGKTEVNRRCVEAVKLTLEAEFLFSFTRGLHVFKS